MDANCYVCSKESNNCQQNFGEIKSHHTQTPITDFIRQFLGDFLSIRNIDDESNCICAECLTQIDDYDWMRQQVSEQETKLRDLLLSTEVKLCVKNEPAEVKEEIEDCHNEMIFADELNDAVSESEIKFEPHFDSVDVQMDDQQPTTIPTIPRSSTSSSNTTSNLVPTLQSNCQPTPVKKRIIVVKRLKRAVLQNAKGVPASATAATISTNANAIKSSMNSTELSSAHHGKMKHGDRHSSSKLTNKKVTNRIYPKPNCSHRCLVAMALINSRTGSLQTSEICKFIGEHFPYFQLAPIYWKSRVRETLRNPKFFDSVELGQIGCYKKYSWTLKPSKIRKMKNDIQKLALSSAIAIRDAMEVPENLPALLCGEMKHGGSQNVMAKPKFPKPVLDNACLIAMALKNSRTGSLLASEVCSFMCEHFPYYKEALSDWRSGIRNTLLRNECFLRTEFPVNCGGDSRFKNLWTMNPSKVAKMDEEIQSCLRNYETNVGSTMAEPENLPALLRGKMKHGGRHSSIKLIVKKGSERQYPKPKCSYRCLVAIALINSRTGSLETSEICNFISKHFPYFRLAPIYWKSKVRGAAANTDYFDGVELDRIGSRKKYSWTMKPSKIAKLDDDIQKLSLSSAIAIRDSMEVPENIPALLRGKLKYDSLNDNSTESNDDVDSKESQLDDSNINSDEDDDDDEPLQIEQQSEDCNGNKFDDNDLQPMAKRARLDMN